jgi:hypothetical protein
MKQQLQSILYSLLFCNIMKPHFVYTKAHAYTSKTDPLPADDQCYVTRLALSTILLCIYTDPVIFLLHCSYKSGLQIIHHKHEQGLKQRQFDSLHSWNNLQHNWIVTRELLALTILLYPSRVSLATRTRTPAGQTSGMNTNNVETEFRTHNPNLICDLQSYPTPPSLAAASEQDLLVYPSLGWPTL